ncbi:MAG: hypothetical protein A2905_04120 [Candidatus Levybacteria bacterium RIFCSPLOWO2_01_FULL_36_10]|nr:MAG: hypothetical protein A2905_04120 [Candidatus Levybacteria bacterium RIFCSPLOWO2_01_FULL_36_10]
MAGALNDFASRNIMNERSDPDPVRTDDHGIVVWSKDKKAGTLNIETNVPLIAKEPELLDREIDLAGFHKFQDIATTETLDNTDPISIVEAHTKSEKVPDLVLDAKTQNLIDLYLSRYSVQNAPSNVKLQEEDLKLPEQQNEVKSIQEQEVVEVEDVYPALHVSEESEAHSAKTDKNEKIDPLVKEKVREDFKQAAKVLGLMEEITQNKQESFARVSRVLDKKFEQDGIEPVVVIRSYVHTAVPEIRSSTIQVPEVDIRVKTQPATFGQVKEVLQEENQPQEKTQEKTLVLPATRVQEDEKVKEEIVVDEEEDEEEEKTKKRPRKINKKVYAKDTGTDKNRMETIVSLAKKALEARPGVDKKIPGQDLDLPGHPPPPELKSEMVRDDPSYPDGSYTKIVEKVTSIGEIRSEDIEYLAFKLVHDNPAVKVETGENNEVPDEAVKTVLDKKRVNKKEK